MFGEWLEGLTAQGINARNAGEYAERCTVVPFDPPTSRSDRAVHPFNRSVLDTLAVDFLSEAAPAWTAPDGTPLTLIGGLPLGRKIYYQMRGPTPFTLLRAGRSYPGLYDHANHKFWSGGADTDTAVGLVAEMLRFFLSQKDRVAAYLARAEAGTLQRTIVIGDNRPTHYLSQSMNALANKVMPALPSFKEQGGSVTVIRDWCFIDPRTVFPALAALPAHAFPARELTEQALDHGLWCQRYIKTGSRSNFATIRAFTDHLRDEARQGRADAETAFTVWVTFDAEKLRFANQVPLIAKGLQIAEAHARTRDLPLRVLWDGWTLGVGVRTERDDRVIARIEAMVAEIAAVLPETVDHVPLYTRSLLEKIALAADAALAIATYGTASLIASVIAGVSTVTAHTAEFVDPGGYSDPENHVTITEPDLAVTARHDMIAHDREFTVNEDAFLAAVHRALEAKTDSI